MPSIESFGFSNYHRRQIMEDVDPNNMYTDLQFPGEKIENLFVNRLRTGTIKSKQITLDITDGEGDIYFAAGTIDIATWTATNGILLGKDDSDANNREKVFFGNATDSFDWNVTTPNKVTITNADITGTLTAGSIHIPDQDTTANSFHVESDGDTWWGCTQTNWTADHDNANAYILSTGIFKFQSGTISGGSNVSFISDSLDTSSRNILKDFVFSPSDYSGAFKTGDITWNTTTGAITGGSGGVFNKAGLVFASAGVPTITLDGTTGSATFAGALSAATGTFAGSLTVGTNLYNTVENQLPDDSTLLAYWSLDEGQGTTAQDYSGNGNNATLSNVTFVTGVSGTAGSWNGTTSYGVASDATDIQNIWDGGGSISFWIYPNSDGESDQGIILSKRFPATASGWDIYVREEAAGYVKLEFDIDFTGAVGGWKTGAVIPVGSWSYIEMVYNSSADTNDPTLYLNGAAITFTETSAPSGSRKSDVGKDLYLGNRDNGSRTFDGYIDEVRFYGSSLTSTNAIALYKNPSGITQQGVKQLGGQYASATTGALMKFDSTQFLINDDSSSQVFKCYLSGANVGDVEIGDYTGSDKGAQWDKSASTFTVKGDLIARRILSGSAAFAFGIIFGNPNIGVSADAQIFSDTADGVPSYIFVYEGDATTYYLTRIVLSDCGQVSDKIASSGYATLAAGSIGACILGSNIIVNYPSGAPLNDGRWFYHSTALGGATTLTSSGFVGNNNFGRAASDGTNVYALVGTTSVKKYTIDTGTNTITYVSTITLANAISITQAFWCDGTYFYGMDNTTNAIRKFDLTGTLVDTSTTVVPASVTGSAYSFFRFGDNYALANYIIADEKAYANVVKPF